MCEKCVTYERKTLYSLLTLPMIILYIAVAAYLWTISLPAFIVYCTFFVLVAVLQGYVCACWECPYIGRFGPCLGGMCLPSSQISRLFRNIKKTETSYTIISTLAFLNILAVIVFPVYFIYQLNVTWLLAYLALATAYVLCFLLFICPVCATRQLCPLGQTGVKLQRTINRNDD